MANPPRFWGVLIGGFAAVFGVIDAACAIGPANGDTACEVLAAKLDTPAKRRAALAVWAGFAVWIPFHIGKDRTT